MIRLNRVLGNFLSKAAWAISIVLLPIILSASASATPHPRVPCSPGLKPCVDMYIVAHQDDDLLFMNPDIQNSIDSGNRVVTVFTTSGCDTCDGSIPDVEYWTGRAKGAINAYTFMANPTQASTSSSVLPTGWAYAPISIANTELATYHYQSGADITLIFLQIPDYYESEAIRLLWDSGAGFSVPSLSCRAFLRSGRSERPRNFCPYGVPPLPVASYTRQGLIDVLAGLMSHYNADSVSTTDGTNLYQTDFSSPFVGEAPENDSHFFSGLFVTVAAAQSETTDKAAPRVVRLYRGYTIEEEPENLSDEEAFPKLLSFARYALYDPGVTFCSDSTLDSPHFCDGNGATYPPYQTDYQHRKYVTRQLQGVGPLSGRLMTTNGDCLRAHTSSLSAGPCNGATKWTLSSRSQLKLGASCGRRVAGRRRCGSSRFRPL